MLIDAKSLRQMDISWNLHLLDGHRTVLVHFSPWTLENGSHPCYLLISGNI
jgi:uncharacterized protein YdhG (YjbR/CyaY superfamily)